MICKYILGLVFNNRNSFSIYYINMNPRADSFTMQIEFSTGLDLSLIILNYSVRIPT